MVEMWTGEEGLPGPEDNLPHPEHKVRKILKGQRLRQLGKSGEPKLPDAEAGIRATEEGRKETKKEESEEE